MNETPKADWKKIVGTIVAIIILILQVFFGITIPDLLNTRAIQQAQIEELSKKTEILDQLEIENSGNQPLIRFKEQKTNP